MDKKLLMGLKIGGTVMGIVGSLLTGFADTKSQDSKLEKMVSDKLKEKGL